MFDSSSDPIVNIPLTIPFDDSDQLDHDALSRNVERWMKTPATGFLVGSQTGEEWFLSEAEKLDAARTVGQTLGEKQVLLGGIDCPSVTETLRRAEAFAEAGAEMVRIRFPRGESTVESYFKQVLARCPVPVLLMHQPEPVSFGLAGRPAAGAAGGPAPEAAGRPAPGQEAGRPAPAAWCACSSVKLRAGQMARGSQRVPS